MCAQCVSKADVVVGTIGFAAFVLHDPVKDALVECGILPEPHPIAREIRTVQFLRRLELDPAPILSEDIVDAVDVALSVEWRKVYRRSLGDTLKFLFGGSIRSQTLPVPQ